MTEFRKLDADPAVQPSHMEKWKTVTKGKFCVPAHEDEIRIFLLPFSSASKELYFNMTPDLCFSMFCV